MILSHADRLERRKAMAANVRAGASLAETAAQWSVSTHNVRRACHEFDVPIQSTRRIRENLYTTLARLLLTQDSVAKIATDLHVHQAWVREVGHNAWKAGIRFPRYWGAKSSPPPRDVQPSPLA